MKTCGYCGGQYNDTEPKCPVCGSTVLKHSSSSTTAADEYARIKKEIEQNRQIRSKIIALSATAIILVIIITISSILGYFANPQRDIDAAAKEQYKSAVQDVRAGKFDSAISTLDAIDPSWSDYEKTKATRIEAVRGILLDRADSYIASGDYKTLIILINSNVDNIDSDSEIKRIYQNVVGNYREQVLGDAKIAFEYEGYESALSIINTGLSVLNEDTALQAERDFYSEYIPVDLTSLTPYASEGKMRATANIEDLFGNTYSTGFSSNYEHEYSFAYKFNSYCIWDLESKYTKLTFVAGIIDDNWQDYFYPGKVQVYGDDILLYEKSDITFTTKPTATIEVDISGVTDLRIELYGSSHACTYIADVLLHK